MPKRKKSQWSKKPEKAPEPQQVPATQAIPATTGVAPIRGEIPVRKKRSLYLPRMTESDKTYWGNKIYNLTAEWKELTAEVEEAMEGGDMTNCIQASGEMIKLAGKILTDFKDLYQTFEKAEVGKLSLKIEELEDNLRLSESREEKAWGDCNDLQEEIKEKEAKIESLEKDYGFLEKAYCGLHEEVDRKESEICTLKHKLKRQEQASGSQ